ncbi:hypothetical protein CALVIDRAFT_543551 [Calocera viscosa TUFC12733]|uniref:Uncharacterized protein n=1 Tax=Calocera viscosa (strain TUFC12733) TaxID=1330018 RepID=A0A167FFJ0_CALVF|nr:hypothetical protein CALVIDRAFT_543551 [Calocera viscosa TUFC12733]
MSDSLRNRACPPPCMVNEQATSTESSEEEERTPYWALLEEMERTPSETPSIRSEIALLSTVSRHPAQTSLLDLRRLAGESRWDDMMGAIWLMLNWVNNWDAIASLLGIATQPDKPPLPFTVEELDHMLNLVEQHEFIRKKQKEVTHILEVGTDGHCHSGDATRMSHVLPLH